MKNTIIARKDEINILEECLLSSTPEFIAVYGRRRVGKTYLIRNYFAQKDIIFFNATGMQDGSMPEQIRNFTDALGAAFIHPGARLESSKNWHSALRTLSEYISRTAGTKKIVLFFDEFPWMASKKSKLLQYLEYFWNHEWSNDSRIKLIICGSSSGWIIKKIINNKKGLYNRVTKVIHLEPFNLAETKAYLTKRGVGLNNKQIAEIYMVIGGIPHYLNQVPQGLSASQVIEKLAFTKNAFLLDEFDRLYATLFHDAKVCIDIVKLIAKHRYGIAQSELLKIISSGSGGGSKAQILDDLENEGFIISFIPKWHRKKGKYYKVIDEYSLFYLYWIRPIKESLLSKSLRPGYWDQNQKSQSWHIWKGYAFEALCYKHLAQISVALGLSPGAIPSTWKHSPKSDSRIEGAQIDLLFDRDDDAITVCEIKYTASPFEIDKNYFSNLIKKLDVFKNITKTPKQLFIAIISANGLIPTMYSNELISKVVTLDDLFEERA